MHSKCVSQAPGWACSLCTRVLCSRTCGGTSTSASRWRWRSSRFSPRQQWKEPRLPSTALWSQTWSIRAEATLGTNSTVAHFHCKKTALFFVFVCSNATACNDHCVSLCVCVCAATVPPRVAQGWPLTTTWVKNCGRSAAACWASPGSDTWQHQAKVHKQFLLSSRPLTEMLLLLDVSKIFV